MKPFRFGVNVRSAGSRAEWAEKARKLEDLGYSALTVPDHLADIFAPMPALVSAAAATKSLRVGTAVLNNDFRHPDLLAREAATVLRPLVGRTAADCARCLDGVSEGQARFKPGDEWSVKEVLDHLIYATALVTERIRDLAAERAPRPFTADSSAGRSTRPIQELRQEMARLLDETVVLVGSLPEGDPPPGTWEHPSLGPLNLKEMIVYHRLHVMDHVQQIEKIKASPGYPAS